MEKKFCHFFVNFVSRKIRLLVKIFRGTRKFFRAARKIFVTDRLLLRKLFVKFFGAARKFSRFLGITLWPLCNCSEKVLSGRFYLECPARAAALPPLSLGAGRPARAAALPPLALRTGRPARAAAQVNDLANFWARQLS